MKRLTDEQEILKVLDKMAKNNKCYWSCQSSQSKFAIGYCYDNPYESIRDMPKEIKDLDSTEMVLFKGKKAGKGWFKKKSLLKIEGESSVLYKLSLRDFFKWAEKTDYKYKGTFPIDKSYITKVLYLVEEGLSMLEDMIMYDKVLVDETLILPEDIGLKEPTINSEYYKFFNAGTNAQYSEALELQNEQGWNKIWVSGDQGVFDEDTWVVYRNISDLPIWLEGYATNQESSKILGVINFTDYKGNVIESIEYKDETLFKKEIEESLNYGRPIEVEDFTGHIYNEIMKNEYGYTDDLPFSTDDKKLNVEEKFLLNSYNKYFEVSAPLIENNKQFFDIFRSLREDGACDFEVKYNPLGFGDRDYHFMYVNTLSDEYTPFCSFEEVKQYMSSESITKFEAISETVENIKLVMEQLPLQFYSDESLLKLMFDHFDNERNVSKFDFLTQINNYVVNVQTQAIKMDFKKNGINPVNGLVNKMLELNKMTKKLNTIKDIKTNNLPHDSDTKDIVRDINRAISLRNNSFEIQI